jgi:hypothetical protein
MSGLGPATTPGVPEGVSGTSTSVPPSAPRFGPILDPATGQPIERSRVAISIDALAKRAGRR